MSLPSRVMPAALPDWLLADYRVAPDRVYATVPMASGSGRHRRIWTASDRRQEASLALLGSAHLDLWHQFVEVTLEAGLHPFAARVANIGPGLRWFDALLLGYETEAGPGRVTRLKARLLLRGEPSRVGPA